MIIIFHDNIRYLIKSGNANDFHDNLPAMRADVANMRRAFLGDQKWFNRPDKWKIQEHFGLTTVKVYGGVEEHKKVRKIEVKDRIYLIKLVPFIRNPDGHGILLNIESMDYDNVTELWDPYDGQGDIRPNYPYPPETFTLPSGSELYLGRKIKSPNAGYELPDFAEAWRASYGSYDPIGMTYKEADNLWGGMFYPGYEWMDFGMPGGGLYEVGLGSNFGVTCVDDGNWFGAITTWVTFLGQAVGPVFTRSATASDHIVTSTGDQISIVAWATASNMIDKWAAIVHQESSRIVWEYYPGAEWCEGEITNLPGTYVGLIEADYLHEYRYLDYLGNNILLDTQTTQNGSGAGFVKLYEYGDRTLFAFYFYSPVSGVKKGGIAENGKATVTDLSYLAAQNHLGIVEFKDLRPKEFTIIQGD